MRAVTLLVGLSLSALASPLFGAFAISIDYTGTFTDVQKSVFDSAARSWETALGDYKPGVTGLTGVVITATGEYIDGAYGILGSAGPRMTVLKTASDKKRYTYATTGAMRFDTSDLDRLERDGRLLTVIQHEMGHVLGFGTLWSSNNVYVSGSGQYTGKNALAAYRVEFNVPTAMYVPVELEGGSGSANAHWDEPLYGSSLSGLMNAGGQDITRELMTAWLNTPAWMSMTTQQSFNDLGYMVPEPGVVGLLLGVSLCMLGRRSRRNGEADGAE